MTFRTPLVLAALALAALPLLDCAALSPIAPGACGNAVIDANEDCDTFTVTGTCGKPDEGARACRFVCDPTKPAAGACPAGWGCGLSGVCREPTGTFTAPSARTESSIVSLEVGDFDGDRRDDLLGAADRGADNASRARVLFSGEDGAIADVFAFPAPLAAPTVRDVDRDGRADLVFGLDGVNVALGQTDRSFRPVLFPSFTFVATAGLVPVAVRGTTRPLPNGSAESRLFASTYTDRKTGARRQALWNLELDDAARYDVTLPGLPSQIVGRGAWGRLSSDPTSTCGEVVFAMATAAPVVVVASPCRPAGSGGGASWAGERAVTVIALPEAPTRGVVLAKVDNDELVDILVTGTTDTFVLRNNGTGFDKPVIAREPRPLAPGVAPKLFDADGVLAAGDLNGDGFSDYILPRGVKFSVAYQPPSDPNAKREASYLFVPSSRSPRWSAAFVGNVNADAFLDFVASSEGAADLEVGVGVPGGTLPATITTPGVVTNLDVGDVDGDNVADVIMTTKQPDDTEELAVAFGSAQGPPAPARTAGRVASGSSLHVGKSVSPTGAVDDVFVLTPHDSEVVAGTNDVQISVVLPSADRQLAAPLLFPAPDPTFVRVDSWRAHTPLIGPFSRVDRNDLLAFAVGVRDFDAEPTRGPVTLWRSRGTGPEAFEALANPRLVLEAESRRPGVKPDARLLLYGATGDLDRGGNGVEEIVLVNPAPSGEASATVIRVIDDVPSPVSSPLPGWKVGTRNQLRLVDVDGDGARDLLGVLGADDQRRGFVLFGDGKGGFEGAPVAIAAPPDPTGDTEVLAVTTLTTAGEGTGRPARTELVLATASRLLRLPIGAGRSLGTATLMLGGFEGLTSVVSGDFDGDGVTDLAVAERGAVRILRQLPRLR